MQFKQFLQACGAPNSIWQGCALWLLAILVLCLIIIITYSVVKIIFRKLENNITAKQHIFTNAFIYALKKPVIFLFSMSAAIFALSILQQTCASTMAFINAWLGLLRSISIIIAITWTIINFISRAEYNLINFPNKKKPVNHTTVLALGRVSKIIVFIVTLLLVLGAFNIDITGVLAFGSAGTLVAGIAAKDMLANFFGGFMIFMDRQFSVGDLIRSPDKNIEGTVEHIGWRVTTIRTMQKLALFVPNAVFLTISIENESKAKNRSIKQVISLRYCDLGKVPLIMGKIESMLAENKDIDHRYPAYIVFNKLASSSLDCLLSCYTKTTELVGYLKVQQDLLLQITQIVQQNGAEIATSTTTVDFAEDALATLEKLRLGVV